MYPSNQNTPFPGKNPKTTNDPEIAVMLDEDGWLNIADIPLSPDGKYNLHVDFAPFISPKNVAQLLLENDLRKWKLPDQEERISYSELPAHEDFKLMNLLNKERPRYINQAGGLLHALFYKLDKVADYGLIKLAAYHKASMETFIAREEAMKNTEEIGINNIPYDNPFDATVALKAAVAPFGEIKVVIWQNIDSANYYHRGWALCYGTPENIEAIKTALNDDKIEIKGAVETRTVRLYVSKYSQHNKTQPKSDSSKPRPSF